MIKVGNLVRITSKGSPHKGKLLRIVAFTSTSRCKVALADGTLATIRTTSTQREGL